MISEGSSVPRSIVDYAMKLGEPVLQRAQSFKTTVLVGQRFVFKFPERSNKPTDTDHKEVRVLQLLAERLDPNWRGLVPSIVTAEEIEGVGFIQVHTRILGEHPSIMTDKLAYDLGCFLKALHDIGCWDLLIEFEGEKGVLFHEYLQSAPDKFLEKLYGNVNSEDWLLVTEAAEYTRKSAEHFAADPTLVLVHKDLYLGNLLADTKGRISGVIDWAAAQTAPREWEFAILRQRMPADWHLVLDAYERPISTELIDLCGLVQSLRFWKSFPHQPEFVAQQRDYIRKILYHA